MNDITNALPFSFYDYFIAPLLVIVVQIWVIRAFWVSEIKETVRKDGWLKGFLPTLAVMAFVQICMIFMPTVAAVFLLPRYLFWSFQTASQQIPSLLIMLTLSLYSVQAIRKQIQEREQLSHIAGAAIIYLIVIAAFTNCAAAGAIIIKNLIENQPISEYEINRFVYSFPIVIGTSIEFSVRNLFPKWYEQNVQGDPTPTLFTFGFLFGLIFNAWLLSKFN
jgi:hypothetical protein